MSRKADACRRWIGAVFLLIALAMLVAGETVLRERLGRVGFVIYWLVCLVFTCLALLVAFLDVWAIRRRTHQEQREFLESAFRDIARERESRSGNRTEPDGPDL